MTYKGYGFLFRSAVATLLSVAVVQSKAEPLLSEIENKNSRAASNLLNKAGKFFLKINVNNTDFSALFYAERFSDGRLILADEAWSEANLVYSGQKYQMENGKTGHDLNSVKGLSFLIDTENQSIKISAPSDAFGITDLTNPDEPLKLKLTSTFGVYMNYNITGASVNAQGGNSYGAFLEGIAFNSFGSFVSSMSASVSGNQTKVVRANTYFQKDNPSKMEKFTIGDATSSGGAWSRPVRFGGLAWSTDFALRQGYVSSATPSINGSAAFPSTVEVLIENQRRQIDSVNAGPFQITNLPSVSGAGEINVIVKDLLGKETRTSQNFYTSPRLLATGLSEFAFETGLLRMNYGTVSSAYESPMFAGTYRRGFNGMTVEGRTEVQVARIAAGVDLAANLNNFAVAHASVSSSKTEGQLGFHQILGFERSSKKININIQAENFDQSFVQFGALSAEAKPHKKYTIGLGSNIYKNINASANIISQSNWNEDAFKYASINFSIPVYKDINLLAYLNKNFGADEKYSLGLHVVFSLLNGSSLAASSYPGLNGKTYGKIDYVQSRKDDDVISYGLSTSNNPSQLLRANVSANTPFNSINIDAIQAQDGTSLRLNMSGSLGLLGGLTFASPHIGHGSFAVVKIAEEANVSIYQSNRKISKTNSSGLALIPNLMPFEKNTISINPEDLPLDFEINEINKVIAPFARSGSIINFDIKKTNNRLVRILTADGIPVLAGTNVNVLPSNTNYVVAKRGEVYLKNLSSYNTILVPLSKGNCTAKVSAPISSSDKGMTIIATCL